MSNGSPDDAARVLRDHIASLKELMAERFRRVDEVLDEKIGNLQLQLTRLEERVNGIKAEIFGPEGGDGHGTRLKLVEERLASVRRGQRAAAARGWAVVLAGVAALASALFNLVFH